VRAQTEDMTRADLLTLPPTVSLYPTAAGILGVGRSSAYEMVRTGEWPTRVLRLGKLIKVPTAELLAYVGVTDDGPEAA
jgi:predicted DNA-binding transcriptional regulator AlpA